MMKLNEQYLRQDFTDFLSEFLPDFEKDVRTTSFESLGAVEDVNYLGKSKKLDLQVFELNHNQSPNARVALATDGFRIMRQSASFRALMVFHSSESSDWRLSLMTLTPEPNEKGKVSVQLSNPRRYSFFLGPNAKVHTPYQFLLKQGPVKDFESLQKRFSIEVVNKDFYQEIAELYTKLVGGVRGVDKNSKRYPGLMELPSLSKGSQTHHEFAVRLIGRIIFCWFLREKKSESGTSLVPEEILSSGAIKQNKDYYHNFLEPLFFEVLNKSASSRLDKYKNEYFDQVPYLNGGLFSPQVWDYYDDKYRFLLKIPDSWFEDFFEILDLYNFTVDENTSVDVDLSIDPEMLGRIFENLLAEINPETGESARKSTGSYYTPRTIVEYMVDESLYQYLKEKTEVGEEKLRALSSYDISDDTKYPLTEVERAKVVEALSNVTILDPACGSGAFPIGALQKIVFMLQRIDPDSKLWFQRQITTTTPEIKKLIEHEFEHKNFDYIRKLGIIRKSIFGVDIQPIATEISRLRCFLTLVVEETIKDNESNRGVEPLPNLDFKFVTANSLIGLPEDKSGVEQQNLLGMDEESEINELRKVMDDYFNSRNNEREECKKRFYEVRDKLFRHALSNNSWNEKTKYLSTWDPFGHDAAGWFDPEWMFGIKDGFDVVIANPPYIQIKQIPWEDKDFYKKNFLSAVGRYNIFYFFIEKSSHLTKEKGFSTFIVPDRLLLNTQCKEIRGWLLKEQQIIEIDSFSTGVFDSAVVDSILLFFKNIKGENYSFVLSKNKVRPEDLYMTRYIKIPIDHFINSPSSQFDLSFNTKKSSLLNKLNKNSIKLGSISEIKDGIIQSRIGKELFLKEKIDSDSKVLLFGKDIDRYVLQFNDNWVNYKPIEMMKLEMKRVKRGPGLRMRRKEIFERNKILTRQTADEIIATYDENEYYYSNTLHGTTITDKSYDPLYVLGILNSKLITWYYRSTTAEGGKVFAQVKIELLRLLPIEIASIEIQKPLISVVKKILALTKSENYLEYPEKQTQVKEYEIQIDQMVYKLYGLTDEEIKIVENSFI